MAEIYETLKRCLEEERLVALATVVGGLEDHLGAKLLIQPDGSTCGDLGSVDLNMQVVRHTANLLRYQRSERVTFETAGRTADIFIEVFPPSPKLVIVGAVHIAIPLVTFAKELGFKTIVVDARSTFATPERFVHADELILRWPAKALAEMGLDESTYVVVLTHDEKLDNPALEIALERPVRYIGALGSTSTHARRVEKLKAQGITDGQLARIHAPIGLDIGAVHPAEIALSIIAEIVAARHGIGLKQPKPMSHCSMWVSGVLLAAGESTRMGGGYVKQLLPFGGEPLVRRVTQEALASSLRELIVIIGFAGDQVRQALAGLDVRIVDNPAYAEGQSTSVKAGLEAIDPAADAALFLVTDQPFLDAALINRLITAYEDTGGPIVVPVFEDRRGSPVLFDRSLFPKLRGIRGDQGGRQLLRRYQEPVVTVELESERPLIDIDTLDTYQRLLAES